jgi:type IV pilus assembly protein PilO
MAAPAAPAKKSIGTAPKLGLGLVFCVAVAGVYYFFFYSDLTSAIDQAVQREQQLQSDQKAADNAYNAFTKDSIELEKKKTKARALNKVLPETSEIGSFLATVNQQAEVAGLKVKVVTPADEQPQPFFTRVPVRLEVAGRFHQLAKFFAGVGRVDRIINVENIELTANYKPGDKIPEGADENTLSAKCLTTTFHANAPKPAGSASGAPGQPAPPPPGGAPK